MGDTETIAVTDTKADNDETKVGGREITGAKTSYIPVKSASKMPAWKHNAKFIGSRKDELDVRLQDGTFKSVPIE